MSDKNLKIAIQNKGRLSEPSVEFLYSLGLKFKSNGRNCITSCENFPLDILYIRDDDIAEYVSRGVADFGILGENVVYEKQAEVKVIKKLGFGKCSLIIAAPIMSEIKLKRDLENKIIATSYPCLLLSYLNKEKINSSIIKLRGSVELAPTVGLSDAICDIARTGQTLKDNNLIPLIKIMDSQAVLIEGFSNNSYKSNFYKLCKF